MDEARPVRLSKSTVAILTVFAILAVLIHFAIRYLNGHQLEAVFSGAFVAICALVIVGIWRAWRQRRFQFRLPTLLCLMLGIGIVAGTYTTTMRRRMENRAAQLELASLGCRSRIASHPQHRIAVTFECDNRTRSNDQQRSIIRNIAVIYDYFAWHHPGITYEFAVDVSKSRFDKRNLAALRELLPTVRIQE